MEKECFGWILWKRNVLDPFPRLPEYWFYWFYWFFEGFIGFFEENICFAK